jgi:multiple sugar transport system permease protein
MKTETIADAAWPTSVSAATKSGGSRRRWRLQLPRVLIPYFFVLPFLLLFLGFFFAPLVYAFDQSLFVLKRSGLGLGPPTTVFVGLANYVRALQDDSFKSSFKTVLIFGAVQIPIMMAIALTLALLMDSAVIRLRRFFRLAAFIPYAVPGVVAVIMWGFFYSPSGSPIVQIFNDLHITPPNFLAPNTVLWSIANISTWEFAGFNMLIFFSALQGIPQEIYESGRMDGLSEIGIALRLKLPLILPAIMFGLLFSMIGTLQLFNEPEILSRASNGIATCFTPNICAYNVGVVNTDLNYGGALAVILGVVTFAFSFVFVRLTRRLSGV